MDMGSIMRGEAMNHPAKLTTQSRQYRERAAELARQADLATDVEQEVVLLARALEWIRMAENGEILRIFKPSNHP
jgi:hypothetical protein